jgi:hypothetical protein
MIARPTLTISHVEELFADELGQLWSPAKVALSWPSANRLRGPCLTVDVIAPARASMTLEQLRAAHLQAAHDVLGSALLSLEQVDATAMQRNLWNGGEAANAEPGRPRPTRRHGRVSE